MMNNSTEKPRQIKRLRRDLLSWYDAKGRTLPWRIRPEDRKAGIVADPYGIWLSEIMCQQTTVTSATPYWHKFLSKWPTIDDLAAAERDEVLTAWAGLGYYARARNLHKCAKTIVSDYGGRFPETEAELLKLPGIGLYTAAAIASICFFEPCTVVDGNVVRLISRLRKVEAPLPGAHRIFRALATEITDPARPGDYAQAVMDLGSIICKPKNPKCDQCVWSYACEAYASGNPQDYPKKSPKTRRPNRYGAVFYLENEGRILLRRRPETGLLGGMMEPPGTEWTPEPQSVDSWLDQAPPLRRNWQLSDQIVTHVFTHFTLHLSLFTGEGGDLNEGIWAELSELDSYALPSVMKKAIKAAQLP